MDEQTRQARIEALRKEIDKGLEQLERGERVPFDAEKIIKMVLERTQKPIEPKNDAQ